EMNPRNSVKRIGEELVLRCSASDCPSPLFLWTGLHDKPLYAKIEATASGSQAVLSPVRTEHENSYVCTVKCGADSTQVKATVKVYDFSSPVITGADHLMAGKATTLTCEVPRAYPAEYVTIEWLEEGKVLKEEESSTTDVAKVTSTFTFMLTPEHDGKRITCKAYNANAPEEEANKETDVVLQLQRLPRINGVLGNPGTSVLEGQSITLSCSVEGAAPIVTVWRKLGPDGQSAVVAQSQTLVMEKVKLSDSGEYECEASSDLGADLAKIQVTIQAPPTNTSIVVSPAAELTEGDSVTVSCTTQSSLATQIVLHRVTQSEERELVSSTGSFTIAPAQLEDSGFYECEAINEHGHEKARVNITVKAYPLQVELSPEQDTAVERGSSLVLTCLAKGCPSPVYTWKDPLDKPLYRQSETNGTQSHLFLRPVGVEDDKTFNCEVQCGKTLQTKSTRIRVYSFPGSPVIEGSGSFTEGQEVRLRCSLRDVFPASHVQIQWLEGDQVLKTEDADYSAGLRNLTSEFTHTARAEDNGKQIVCKAHLDMEGVPEYLKTKSALISLTMQSPPMNTLIVVSPAAELKEGDSVTVSCTTQSSLATQIVLRRVRQNEEREMVSSTGLFTIAPAQLEDSGLYECEAINEHGREKDRVQITVKAPPRNTTVMVYPSMEVLEGQNVTITCKTVSYPPPAIILRKLDNGTSLYSPNGTFELYNLTTNDTGLYEVNVTNDLGFETEIFIIRVGE
ncbi:VCAM1 protein, partial [Amia calva]|nr:VCAM1 protein [Amia calva]